MIIFKIVPNNLMHLWCVCIEGGHLKENVGTNSKLQSLEF